MFKLYIFSVIAIALIYQPLPSEASGKDEAKKLFHKVMENIDKALTEAQIVLNKDLDKVKAEATKLESKAVVELDKILAPLRKKLDGFVAKATAKGFDVSKCQKYVNAFSKTPDILVKHLVNNCVNNQISTAQKYINDALTNAKKIVQDINTIGTTIDSCEGNTLKSAKCYAKIIEQIAKESVEAQAKIIADVTKTTTLISKLLPTLEACFLLQLKKSVESAAKNVAEFAVCATV